MRSLLSSAALVSAAFTLSHLSSTSSTVTAAPVTLSNVIPRVDTDGNILDLHDGDVLIIPIDGVPTYHWYAAGYGECVERNSTTGCEGGFVGCGFLTNHSVNLYTSTDLVAWENKGNVLPVENRVNLTLFCPKVAFCAKTNLYTLVYNFVPAYSYGVATSTTPDGPFLNVSTDMGASFQYGAPNNSGVGDFSILVDDDGSGYMLYSANHHCQIEALNENFTGSTYFIDGRTSGVFEHGNEAPAFFKRRLPNGTNVYFALISDSCCYCEEGGLVHAYSALHPIGPYTYLGEIAEGPNPFGGNVATSSQQTNVFPVTDATTGEITYVWQGDRWQSAPDRLKGHDFIFMEPLTFLPNGSIQRLTWMDNFTVSV